MKITNIKAQSKRKDRVSIYIDEKYSFSLSLRQLGAQKLHVDDQISAEQVNELKEESDVGKLYDKALQWLIIRPRSDWEINQYLFKKTKDEDMRQSVYAKIDQNGFVDDRNFAARWVNNRRLLKPMSTYKLHQELLNKRVPKEIIEEVLKEDETEDLDTAKTLILKRRNRYDSEQKLLAYMSRQGYSYGVIKQALEEIKEQE